MQRLLVHASEQARSIEGVKARLTANVQEQLNGLFPAWWRLDAARYAQLLGQAAQSLLQEISVAVRVNRLRLIASNNPHFYRDLLPVLQEQQTNMMEKRGVTEGEYEPSHGAQAREPEDQIKQAEEKDVQKPCCGGKCGSDPLSRMAEKVAER